MATIIKIERMLNIINRAVKEFDFKLDVENPFIDEFQEAEDYLLEEVDYDRIETVKLNRHNTNLYYNDGMGFEYECDGDFFGAESSKMNWWRDLGKGKFQHIEWFEADAEKDFIEVDRVVDSEGKVVLLVAV